MQVYISHATADEALARQLSNALQHAGLDVWDGTEILPGENWADKIAQALRESQAMVVLLTPDSIRSGHVKRDISYALGNLHYDRRLISVLTASPSQLHKEDIPWILNNLPMVTLKENEQNETGFAKVAQAVKEANLVLS
jgi:hypothetical protein